MTDTTTYFNLPYLELGDSITAGMTVLSSASMVDSVLLTRSLNEIQLAKDLYANNTVTGTGNAVRSVSLEQELTDHWSDFGEVDWVSSGLDAVLVGNYQVTINGGRGYNNGKRVSSSGSPSVLETRDAPPTITSITSASTSGSITGNTHYYLVTLHNGTGESSTSGCVLAPSSASAITTYVNTVTWTPSTSASFYRIYRGTSASGFKLIKDNHTSACLVDPGYAQTATNPPSSNNAVRANTTFYLYLTADSTIALPTSTNGSDLYLATIATGSSGSITTVTDQRMLYPTFSRANEIWYSSGTTAVPTRIYGYSGQTANLTNWYSSASVVIASIGATGVGLFTALNVGNATGAALGQIVIGDGAAAYIKAYDASTYRSLYLDANQYYFRISGTSELSLNAAALYPSVDLGLNLGDAAARWNTTYTSAINVGSAVGAGAGSIYLSDGIGQGTIIAYNGSYHVLNVVGSSIILYVGIAAKAQLSGVSFGPFADLGTNLGSPAYRWNQLYTAAIAVGTNPSTTGLVQIPNNAAIAARNAANSADIPLISADGSNRVVLGSSSFLGLSLGGVNYSVPASQGGASTVLTNNGSGTLTWTVAYPEEIEILDNLGTLTVVTGKVRLYFPWDTTIVGIKAAVNTASSGASIIIDVNKNGVTLFTTQGNRPTIAAGSNTVAEVTNMNVTTFSAGDYLTVDIDQIGSGTAGSDLTVIVRFRRT